MKNEGPPTRALVIRRGDRVELVTPYDKAFHAELLGIPYRWRSFDSSLKSWTVREPHVEEVVTLAHQYFALEFLAVAP